MSESLNRPSAVCDHVVQICKAGWQTGHRDVQNKATLITQAYIFFVLEVPGRRLPSYIANVVPCDYKLQEAYSMFFF